jgi:hypothetical protein
LSTHCQISYCTSYLCFKAGCTFGKTHLCAVITMSDYSKAPLIMPKSYDNYATGFSSLNLLNCCHYSCNGNARINRMDRVRICAHSGCDGSCVENRQTTTDPRRGRSALIDHYTIAGLVAMVFAAGLIGFRLTKDEMLLRRKSADRLIFKAGA